MLGRMENLDSGLATVLLNAASRLHSPGVFPDEYTRGQAALICAVLGISPAEFVPRIAKVLAEPPRSDAEIRRRLYYVDLTDLPTPDLMELTELAGQAFSALHDNCPKCGPRGEHDHVSPTRSECPACTRPDLFVCEEFCPARMRGMGHTFYVCAPWTPGSLELAAWVIDISADGPAGTQYTDMIGPFADVPAALAWASSVVGKEISLEMED
jgi:ribosomal protein S27AE